MKSSLYIISANDLLTGEVVYLNESGKWSNEYKSGIVLQAEKPEHALGNIDFHYDTISVLDIVAQQVSTQGLDKTPIKMRARMRQTGPSIVFGQANIAPNLPFNRAA